ncbi:apoptotic chromatin condensation inducer in the nucleus isoform X1 [Oncorhynchus kisutch]|uniref:Apoptotic chromatin condensation inducer 1b n=1 Tax=Oncorhynchus kisutch TaxID=8019 RepID=A0A8C7M8Z5_ONCKI|nr:apoptotic chromatin condensation inducer in the nucleus isoform X1 [Oncorhynchus kisutch]
MADEDVTLNGKPLQSLRVADLKAALEQRCLPKSGAKNTLIKRLKGALMLENLQRTSTPHIGLQPNSQIGEEMSQNSFIKQYLAQQQELLRQRLEREAREAAEADESPAGPEEEEHTEEGNDSDSYNPDKHRPMPSQPPLTRAEEEGGGGPMMMGKGQGMMGQGMMSRRPDFGPGSVPQESPDAPGGPGSWMQQRPSLQHGLHHEEPTTPSPPRAVASLSVRVLGDPERQGLPPSMPPRAQTQEKEGTAPADDDRPAHSVLHLSRSARAAAGSNRVQEDCDDDDDSSEEDEDEWGPAARRGGGRGLAPPPHLQQPSPSVPAARERSRRKLQPPQHIPPQQVVHQPPMQLRQPTPPPSPPPELSFPLPDTPKQSPPDMDEDPEGAGVSVRPPPGGLQRQDSDSSSRSSSPEPRAKRRPGPLSLLARKMASEGAYGKRGEGAPADSQTGPRGEASRPGDGVGTSPGAGAGPGVEVVMFPGAAITHTGGSSSTGHTGFVTVPEVPAPVVIFGSGAQSHPLPLLSVTAVPSITLTTEPQDPSGETAQKKTEKETKQAEEKERKMKQVVKEEESHLPPWQRGRDLTLPSAPSQFGSGGSEEPVMDQGDTQKKSPFGRDKPLSSASGSAMTTTTSPPAIAPKKPRMFSDTSSGSMTSPPKPVQQGSVVVTTPGELPEPHCISVRPQVVLVSGAQQHTDDTMEVTALNKASVEKPGWKAGGDDEKMEKERDSLAQKERASLAEKERVSQVEKERASQVEKERASQAEKERASQAEKERASQAEKERASQAEKERASQAEKERASQAEKERASQAEKERASQAEKERASQAEKERASQAEKERASQAEKERACLAEKERASLAEKERASLAEKERASLAEKERASLAEKERASLAEKERASLAEKERASLAEKERASLAEKERASQAEKERASQAEKERASQEKGTSKPGETRRRGPEETVEVEPMGPVLPPSYPGMGEDERKGKEDERMRRKEDERKKEAERGRRGERARRRRSSPSSGGDSSSSDSGSSSSRSSGSTSSQDKKKKTGTGKGRGDEKRRLYKGGEKKQSVREVKQSSLSEPSGPMEVERPDPGQTQPTPVGDPQNSEGCMEESTTPKAFAARKISLTTGSKTSPEGAAAAAGGEAESGTAAGRKRRWGSSTAVNTKKPSISITTDSLKSLIPDIKPSQDAVVDLHPDDIQLSGDEDTTREDQGLDKGLKIRRTVTQVVPSENQENGQGEQDEEEEEKKPEHDRERTQKEKRKDSYSEDTMESQSSATHDTDAKKVTPSDTLVRRSISQQKSGVSVTIDDPVRTAKQPSPPRGKVSNIVHVCNLVRPFTLGQLKELLNRTGSVVEDGFWIDKIKSHCYVTYSSTEEAVATRAALHGVKWPQSNPKVLSVDFCEQNELDFHRGLLAVDPREEHRPQPGVGPGGPKVRPGVLPPLMDGRGDRGVVGGVRDQWAEREREMERRERTRAEREWDRDKVRDFGGKPGEERERGRRSRSLDRERRRKERDGREKKADKKDEPPAKLLDDLFNKTKAAPCIYWLPLTEEQANQRGKEREERQKERERRRKEQQEEEDKKREEERKERIKSREEGGAAVSTGSVSVRGSEGERERGREREGEKRRDSGGFRPRGPDTKPSAGFRRSRSRSNPRDKRR